MADPAVGGGVMDFVKEHPYAVGGCALALVVVIWYMQSSSSSTASGNTGDNSSTDAAAAVQQTQTQANEALAAAGIAAGVTNNQTAAAQTVALAQAQAQVAAVTAAGTAQVGTAYYGAISEVAASNAATQIAGYQAQTAQVESENTAASNEYGSLATLLKSLGGNAQALGTSSSPNASSAFDWLSQMLGGGVTSKYASSTGQTSAENSYQTVNSNAGGANNGVITNTYNTVSGSASIFAGSGAYGVVASNPTSGTTNTQQVTNSNYYNSSNVYGTAQSANAYANQSASGVSTPTGEGFAALLASFGKGLVQPVTKITQANPFNAGTINSNFASL